MNELILTAPEGALCNLYSDMPTIWKFSELDAYSGIPATQVTLQDGIASYHYEDLAPGLYHYSPASDYQS